jgi:hypothetical protein
LNQSVTDQSIWPLPLSRARDARQGVSSYGLFLIEVDDLLYGLFREVHHECYLLYGQIVPVKGKYLLDDVLW